MEIGGRDSRPYIARGCAREREKRKVKGEQKRKREAVRRSPRALCEDGYKYGDGYPRASSRQSSGLEGREEDGKAHIRCLLAQLLDGALQLWVAITCNLVQATDFAPTGSSNQLRRLRPKKNSVPAPPHSHVHTFTRTFSFGNREPGSKALAFPAISKVPVCGRDPPRSTDSAHP